MGLNGVGRGIERAGIAFYWLGIGCHSRAFVCLPICLPV